MTHGTSVANRRWVVAIACALLTGSFTAARVYHEPHWPTDFDQIWHAARALLDGIDPYSVVGPGKAFEWLWPLYYPLPAVLYAVPLAVLPIELARVAFSTIAGGVLGWAAGARWQTHWPLLLSAAYIISASRNQWSPFFLAAAWLPPLSFLLPAKPNVGAASLAGMRGSRLLLALGSSAAVILLSFVIRPDWFVQWREAIRTSPHIQAPLLTLPIGPLLGLAALRWRRPEARLFLAFVILPHTPSLYDLVLLFFVCRTLRETLALAVLTQCLFWGIVMFGSYPTFDEYAAGLGRVAIVVVYIPVLLSLLARPNRVVDPDEQASSGRLAFLPDNRLDAVFLAILVVGAIMLIWLPLVTYR